MATLDLRLLADFLAQEGLEEIMRQHLPPPDVINKMYEDAVRFGTGTYQTIYQTIPPEPEAFDPKTIDLDPSQWSRLK